MSCLGNLRRDGPGAGVIQHVIVARFCIWIDVWKVIKIKSSKSSKVQSFTKVGLLKFFQIQRTGVYIELIIMEGCKYF